ncbi:MAG: Uncharacterized MFS-type transporter, partial [uncultured Corynebacteriales bacterium]
DRRAAGPAAPARPAALAGPDRGPGRRVHGAAGRQHRERRAAQHRRRHRRRRQRAAVGGQRVRAGLRPGPGGRRPDRRRPRPAPGAADRAGGVRAGQRGVRAGAGPADADRRPVGAGSRRRPGHPAELRADPEPVPRRGARPGVRPVRRGDRDQHRDRSAARRAAHPGRRGRGRLAVDLLRQRADRHRGDGAGVPHGPAHPAAAGGADGLRPGRRGAARGDHGAGAAAVRGEPVLDRQPDVGAAGAGRAARHGLRPLGAPVLPARRRADGRPDPVRAPLLHVRGDPGAGVLRRLQRPLLRLQPVPAGRRRLHRAAGRAGVHPVRDRRRGRRRPGRPVRPPDRPGPGRGRPGAGARRAARRLAGHRAGGRRRRRLGGRRAVPARRAGQRTGHLAQPDAHPVRGAAGRGRGGRRGAADRPADRRRRRHRPGRQPLLRPPAERLRRRGPARVPRHHRFRRAGPGGRGGGPGGRPENSRARVRTV